MTFGHPIHLNMHPDFLGRIANPAYFALTCTEIRVSGDV